MAEDLGQLWMDCMRRGEFASAWDVSDHIGTHVRRLDDYIGRRVLIRCEHGLGDTLQFLRYARVLRPLVTHLLLHIQPRLLPLARFSPEFDHLFTWEDPWPHGQYDVEVEVMELAYLFRSTCDTLPREVPYLHVSEDLVHGAAAECRRPGCLNVGIQWTCGNWDERRSFPPSTLAGLDQLEGIRAYSLEPKPGAADVTHTAAEMMNLDLIITPDTMTAHLAGGLGRPTWVLLPHQADWRWMAGREDSPWYPTMRLFRQERPGDWSTVGRRVTEALTRLATGNPRP